MIVLNSLRRTVQVLERASYRCLAAAVAPLLAATMAQAAEPLTLYYNERPPYLVTRSSPDKVVGLTADPASQAFVGAGLAPRWTAMPSTRQLVTLRESAAPACAVGWFKNPDREAVFKFTKAIYRDKPTVALARGNFDPTSKKLAEVLHQAGLRILVKDKYSYGPWIDAQMASARPQTVVTTEENVQMVRMIAGQRADIMFSSQEEAQYLVAQSAVAASAVKILQFDDVPPGEKRYLMCSRGVSDDIIRRLDGAITFE